MCCNVLHIKNITRCAIGIHPSEFGINMHTDSQFWQVFITDTSDESAVIQLRFVLAHSHFKMEVCSKVNSCKCG